MAVVDGLVTIKRVPGEKTQRRIDVVHRLVQPDDLIYERNDAGRLVALGPPAEVGPPAHTAAERTAAPAQSAQPAGETDVAIPIQLEEPTLPQALRLDIAAWLVRLARTIAGDFTYPPCGCDD